MVTAAFGWDTPYMFFHFGHRAAAAVFINAAAVTLLCREAVIDTARHAARDAEKQEASHPPTPLAVTLIHLAFLIAVVLTGHHPAVFLGLLMLFIGYAHAYRRHQDRLLIREGLMVGFFLAGLVVLGGMQKWWLQNLLGERSPLVLFWGATALTAITDNAALTYLGSLVEGSSESWRYMLVAGAVTGGGLTVIANAPNPAGFAVLRGYFPDEAISPGKLFLAALVPTLVAAAAFLA
jgi:Na+/H+ antiporter NhaD/arsenite permease-like protein